MRGRLQLQRNTKGKKGGCPKARITGGVGENGERCRKIKGVRFWAFGR